MRENDRIAILAIGLSFIMVLIFVPNTGFIQTPWASITIVPLVVMLLGLLLGPRSSLLYALVFGLASFFLSHTRATSATDLLFQDPLVSVLPRLLWGFALVIAFYYLKKYPARDGHRCRIQVGIVGGVLSLIHTILVITILLLLKTDSDLFKILVTIFTVNSMVEMVLAAILLPMLYFPMRRILRQRGIIDGTNAENA